MPLYKATITLEVPIYAETEAGVMRTAQVALIRELTNSPGFIECTEMTAEDLSEWSQDSLVEYDGLHDLTIAQALVKDAKRGGA